MSYYNTTKETTAELRHSKVKASKQDELILNFFKARPNQMFSPDDVHRNLFTEETPITSVRRAMTDLTDGLYLEKTEMKVMGNYGKLVHTWKLKINYNQQLNLL